MRKLLLILFLLSFSLLSQAQVVIPGSASRNSRLPSRKTLDNKSQSSTTTTIPNDTASRDSTEIKGLIYNKPVPDSVLRAKVFFFTHKPFSVKIDEMWNPTLDPTGVQYSDPIDGFNGNYYLGKGVLGHPHTPIFYRLPQHLKVDFQQEEFETYLKTPENIRFYQTLTPYTLLSYNNSLNKDYLLRIAHTQNVIPGWNLALDYRLINPEGPFANSAAKNHYLDVTTNYFSSDSRLQAYGGIIWQDFTIDENGGITDDSYFTSGEMSNQSGLPMTISGAGSTHLRRNAFAGISYNLVPQVERTRQRDSLVVRSDTAANGTVSIVTDTIEVTDTLRTSPPRTLNVGVFGIEASYSRRQREAAIPNHADSTQWDETYATLFWTNDAYPDYRWRNPLKITVGITPRRISGYLIADSLPATRLSAFSLLNPFIRAQWLLGRMQLTAETQMDNTKAQLDSRIGDADYRTSASLLFCFDSLRLSGIEAKASLRSATPDVRMLQRSGFALKPVRDLYGELHLFRQSGTRRVNRLVDISLSATNKSHNVWYDTALAVCQGHGDFWLFQAAFTLRFQWHWFYLDMQQLLQHSTDTAQMPLPLWSSKNSLYVDFPLFSNALRLQLGADLRCYTAFAPPQYDPATGLFYRQPVETGNYLWADAFLNLQVKRVSIYLKGGHLNALWEKHPSYFLLPHYPGQRFGLFWGITWNFFD